MQSGKNMLKAAFAGMLLFSLQMPANALTDDEIRIVLIRQSISSYSGRCPCPYNVTRNGSRCGKRSAYSRPGGARPYCYLRDVPQLAVERYKRRHRH